MDKASRVIRRSGVKLLSMGGHSDLHVMISEVKDMRTSAKAFLQAQHLTSQDMLRWAAHEDNRAIQDVVSQVAELNSLWTDVQRDFIERLKEFRQMFEMILTGQKHVSHAKSNLNVCEQKEVKVRKELKGAAKRASPAEIRIFENRLTQAQRAKDMAQVEVSDRVRENEAVKLIRLKEGLLKFTESYIEMATKCTILFSSQREVALQLPDVHGRDLEEIKYTGSNSTRYYVQEARGKLLKYRSSSCSSSTSGDTMNDPPPPYTPPDPIVNETPRAAPRTSLPTRLQDMEHSTTTSLPRQDPEHSNEPARSRRQASGSFSSTHSDNSGNNVPMPRPNTDTNIYTSEQGTSQSYGFYYESNRSESTTDDEYAFVPSSSHSNIQPGEDTMQATGEYDQTHSQNQGNGACTPRPDVEPSTSQITQNTGKLPAYSGSTTDTSSNKAAETMKQNPEDRPPSMPDPEYVNTPPCIQDPGGNMRPRQLYTPGQRSSVHDDEYSTADEDDGGASGGVQVR